MNVDRRDFIVMSSATLLTGIGKTNLWKEKGTRMYGLIVKIAGVAGKRDALIEILLENVSGMPGCLSYVIAKDSSDANAVWITEVWDSEQSHRGSLSLPSVQAAMTRGKPLIAGFGSSNVTEPVGGQGLVFQ